MTQNSRGGSARKCSQQAGDGGTTPYGRHRVGTDTSSGKGFMGQTWDGGDVAFRPETWEAVMRVMKPGAYLMAFGGSRTFHRLAVALEDAGFVLVDTLMWLYGSGFPKSHNVAASIDKALGGSGQRTAPPKINTYDSISRDPSRHSNPADQSHTGHWGLHSSPHGLPTIELETSSAQTWNGYGTALKPAYEPILLCRKPGEKTYAANALKWGCGAMNIDRSRIAIQPDDDPRLGGKGAWRTDAMAKTVYEGGYTGELIGSSTLGRWPANVMLDEAAAEMLDAQPGVRESGVSRFFYVTKVSTKERQAGMGEKENDHPTMKPIDLARQLATLLLPPQRADGPARRLLVPFSGSGSEMIGALTAGWDEVTGVEQSTEYADIARKRLAWWAGETLVPMKKTL
ncbi:site-specific DNA-methyltransferase [Acidithiobacillus sp. RW2]|uniref:Methyltransferase n=1 Tax=Acidithiobacillus sulfurivorans TaxID=1958756 RepID=A0ABS5ZYQ6_9PROT|nr:site-specific DNA-methyltransferase [Acidithiobacillus sulfurivorans]